MDGIVVQLENDIINNNTDIVSLLRKAKVIGVKLELNEFVNWVDLELNGYDNIDIENMPDYRKINCPILKDVIESNRFGKQIYIKGSTVENITPEFKDKLQLIPIKDAISEIKGLSEINEDYAMLGLTPEGESFLKKHVDATIIYNACPKLKFDTIINQVINKLLNWVLQLEKEGILGEGLDFTEQEKDFAKENKNSLNIFIGSKVQIGDNNQINTKVEFNQILTELSCIRTILQYDEAKILTKDNIEDINEKIANIESEIKKPNPNNSFLKENVISIRNIIENFAGNILASLIIPHLNQIINIIFNAFF